MERYNIGDIVKFKLLGDINYYMITDFIDFSMNDGEAEHGEKELDVEYELVLIYPISENTQMESTLHQELDLVAKFKSRKSNLILDYIFKERLRMNLREVPLDINHVVGKLSNTKKAKLPNKKKSEENKFGMEEITDILEDDEADNRIKEFVEEMNNELELLYYAIQNKSEKDIEEHKENLKVIRSTLMELEYFSFKHSGR